MPGTIDDEYHQYLWGEGSPRSFARRAKVAGNSRHVNMVVVDRTVDIQKVVSR